MQDREILRKNLLEQGYSISSWSKKYKFSPMYVHKILSRYLPHRDPPLPNSPTVYKIIEQMRIDTGIDLLDK